MIGSNYSLFVLINDNGKVLFSNKDLSDTVINFIKLMIRNNKQINQNKKYIIYRMKYLIKIYRIPVSEDTFYIVELLTLRKIKVSQNYIHPEPFVNPNNSNRTIEDALNKIYLDNLTGILNRNFWEDFRNGKIVLKRVVLNSLILIDIDNLKAINDIFGHSTGDECIKNVANALKLCKLPKDIAIRFGGDEFVVLSSYDKNNINIFINEFKNKLLLNKKIKPDVSIGVSFLDDISNIDKAFHIADTKMYEEKKLKKMKKYINIYYEIEDLYKKINEITNNQPSDINSKLLKINEQAENIIKLIQNFITSCSKC